MNAKWDWYESTKITGSKWTQTKRLILRWMYFDIGPYEQIIMLEKKKTHEIRGNNVNTGEGMLKNCLLDPMTKANQTDFLSGQITFHHSLHKLS